METVAVVVSEILVFLAVAWVLGFFVAWAIFRPIQLKYKREIEESEENIDYLKSVVRNQEKEITKLTREVKKLSDPQSATKEFLEAQKKKQKKRKDNNTQPKTKNKLVKSKNDMLQMIEATLEGLK